jgi:hypothetical protein
VVIPGLANALHALSAEHAAYFVVGVHEKIGCGGLFFLAAGGTCEDDVLRQASQTVNYRACRGVIGIAARVRAWCQALYEVLAAIVGCYNERLSGIIAGVYYAEQLLHSPFGRSLFSEVVEHQHRRLREARYNLSLRGFAVVVASANLAQNVAHVTPEKAASPAEKVSAEA